MELFGTCAVPTSAVPKLLPLCLHHIKHTYRTQKWKLCGNSYGANNLTILYLGMVYSTLS